VRRVHGGGGCVHALCHELLAAGEMAWSSRLIRSQLGMVAQAGAPEGWVNAVLANGRCVAASSMASWVETSPAKMSRKSAVLM